ncbi:sulfatase-like hydrolase/transferase [Roseibacillus ishigakijimensis]|uniref:Sulfatase-like hydrolase/transferase n=1 Tax=Roseibacillus ishigakijimensis TaxID=454146 RepID=A0A934RKD0_9BACT|nr:sulfatase-like hydrolase/transferase [Roseibacillus ishigakijimensis]MBK1832448.1 sulfatase-like hydrolase/transferase [Roseibacillus ishigakijimensis]
MKFFVFLCLALTAFSTEKPNILWITSEDNGADWLGCYGNEQARTPHLDALAARSVRFANFYSNAPVCAVARSTILTGVYAPSQGTQHMRSRHPIPASHLPYVSYLREAGYYCTNASKTDFNREGDDKTVWDACHGKAHYKNRAEGQPFFAIFNLTESHESSLFPARIAQRRKSGQLPPEPRLALAEVEVPPYLPDLPEIRSDIADYHDTLTLMDRKVGEILAELEERGLAEDTIVFYYSDHGGALPRGKRYLKDTGVKVPLLIHVPAKWQQLAPHANGEVVSETAAFIDLAPTLLSLAGLPKPAPMLGRAFLGQHREEGDPYVFLFADRFDDIYGMRRGLTDGRFKYIRRFSPHLPAAPYSFYQFGQKGWQAWRQAWQAGELSGRHAAIWESDQPVEELFDTTADPWEVTNLADDPSYQVRLQAMREALAARMVRYRDTGLIPEPMFPQLAPGKPIADFARSHQEEWPELVELAFLASAREVDQVPLLRQKLAAKSPLKRFWAAQGCLILGKQAAPAEPELKALLSDPFSANRIVAAQALAGLGQREAAVKQLLAELADFDHPYTQQFTSNVLQSIAALEEIPQQWVEKALRLKENAQNEYIIRLANRLVEERAE